MDKLSDADKKREAASLILKRIELPFSEAVSKAAKQNFDRDVRHGLAHSEEWATDEPEYRSEARANLLRDGENILPEFPDTEHIAVLKKKKTRGT